MKSESLSYRLPPAVDHQLADVWQIRKCLDSNLFSSLSMFFVSFIIFCLRFQLSNSMINDIFKNINS